MAAPTQAQQSAFGYFHSLQKVKTEETQNVFESQFKSSHNVQSSEVWAENVPFAADVTAADAAAASFPATIKKYSFTSLTEVVGSNGQAWFIDDGGTFVRPWIDPVDIPNSVTNIPSTGYEAKLFESDDTQVPPATGSWSINYYAGMVLFEPGFTPADLGYGVPKISAYAYIGGTVGGSSLSETAINQTAHGFIVGDSIYHNGTVFAKAQSDDVDTLSFLVVTSVEDVDNFRAASSGFLDSLTGLVAGQYYYLSDTTAGEWVAVEPTISNPVFFANTTTSGWILPFRPALSTSSVTAAVFTQIDVFTSTAGQIVYALSQTPNPNAIISMNGLELIEGASEDYTITGSTLNLNNFWLIIDAGYKIKARYNYTS